MTFNEFMQKQNLPYEAKVVHAEVRAREFYETLLSRGQNVHVSVGGLDSITLLLFLRSNGLNIPAISVTSLEDKSIQAVHTQLGVIPIKPLKSKVEVIKEYGYPVISKSKAAKIEIIQQENEKQTFIHAIMTGEMGKQGKFGHSEDLKLQDKWIRLFGGMYQHHRPDMKCKIAPFKVSNRCCEWLKKKPVADWQKENNSYPYLGMMASEGGQREIDLKTRGCNFYGTKVTRSCPFAPFMRQDLLQLALDLNVPVPEIYGEIKRKPDGTLYTTRAQRTGCSMCGFGIHIEKRPHRFDRLREDNPKEWEFWMYDMGWGKVLDWIGVEWEGPVGAMVGQLELDAVGGD